MAKQRSQTFMFGAIILMFSNILVKIIGAFFKIPITNILGSEGMSYFNAAYSIYVSFYMISTAGIPVAISRMIATANSQGNKREIDKIFRMAYIVFFVIGIVSTGLMIALSRFFATNAHLDNSVYAMIAIAPTIFFICLTSAYRGYYQGLQNMTPTAVSQVIESLCKLFIGLALGVYFTSIGYEVHYVAAFVIFAVTIGTAACTVYLAICKAMYKDAQSVPCSDEMPVRSNRQILYELVIISLPISLSSSIMGLTNVVDTMLATRRLVESGVAENIARMYYGSYTSMAVTLFNMPTNLIYPFAISVLPLLSALFAKKDMIKAKETMEATFRITAIIAIPCALGLSALSHPILNMLFNTEIIEGSITTTYSSAISLSILAIAIFFVGIIAVTNSMLQAFGLQNKPIISTCLGIVAKIISAYFLIGVHGIGITGAAISSALCYFTIMVVNMYFLTLKTGFFPKMRKVFIKPFVSGVLCAAVALAIYRLSIFVIHSNTLSVAAGIVAAVIVYVISLMAFKGIERADILLLPKGEKLCTLLTKMHVLKSEE